MPIRVQNDLPVKEILEHENIFVMDEYRAAHQDIRPISIGLLNLMPLKEDTELQILRSLSNTPLQVDVTFVRMTSHVSKNTSTSHIYKFYESFEDIKMRKFDGNVLGPKILGDSTGLSAFWVVFSILIGGGLFGVPGMILGVPTFAVVYYIVGMLVNNKLEKKKLPVKTDAYDEYSYVESDGTYVHADKNIFKEKER